MRTRVCFSSLLIVAVLVGCSSTSDFLGPMVQIGDTDGQTALLIVWRTVKPMDSRVDYGLTLSYGNTIFDQRQVSSHSMTLRNLRPGARYFYQVISGNKVIGRAYFYTGKPEEVPFKFIVFGDSGTGNLEQYSVAWEMEKWNPDFIIHTGDLIGGDGESEKYPRQFYYPYKNLIARIPFFPSLGNHDYETGEGRPFVDNFYLPGAEKYYSYDYGNTHFVCLNSNKPDEESARWLENDLASTGKLWKIVYFHHPPPFSPGHFGEKSILDLWVPLFEKYKVDLVFCGHHHIYARYKPINGVNYVIEGAGGRILYGVGRKDFLDYWYNQRHGFGWVEIDGRKLVFSHINNLGEAVDTFSLEK